MSVKCDSTLQALGIEDFVELGFLLFFWGGWGGGKRERKKEREEDLRSESLIGPLNLEKNEEWPS